MSTPQRFRQAEPSDNSDLCDMFAATPMEGAVRLSQDRRPNYFHGTAVQCEQPEVYVPKQKDETGLTGVFGTGLRRVFVNGQPQPVRYLSDLRIAPSHRGGSLLARGFRFLRSEVFKNDEYAQSLVVTENKNALNLLTSGRCGLPGYFQFGDYVLSLISLRRPPRAAPGPKVRRATSGDVSAMQAFFDREAPGKQFFPVYDFAEWGRSDYYRDAALENIFLAHSGNELVGLLGAWDQGGYKKTVVRGYGGALRWLRPWLNAVSRLRGGIELPAPGSVESTLYLHCALCCDNDPGIMSALLRGVQQRFAGQNYRHATIGLDQRDPLREALAGCRTMDFAGCHFLVSFGTDPRPNIEDKIFYFEAARI